MYGLVNQAVVDLIKRDFGPERCAAVLAKAGISDTRFLAGKGYDDALTYAMIGAASEILEQPAETLLHEFGRFWVLETASKKYADLMDAAGDSFPAFLESLPDLHSRILLILPGLEPPEFSITERGEKRLQLVYRSHREGLQPFVIGLLHGLGERFKTTVHVTHSERQADADIFNISWD